MIDSFHLLAFLPVALALNLTPGPDMLFCLAQGAANGPRAALAAALGVSLGGMVHVALAGLGLAALLAAAPEAFTLIRLAGGGYLLWIAWRTWRHPLHAQNRAPRAAPRQALFDGLLVNLTNPKYILFVLALLPQFIDPARPPLPQFLIFGLILGAGGVAVNGAVGAMAGRARRLLARPRFERINRGACATLFAGLGARLLLVR